MSRAGSLRHPPLKFQEIGILHEKMHEVSDAAYQVCLTDGVEEVTKPLAKLHGIRSSMFELLDQLYLSE